MLVLRVANGIVCGDCLVLHYLQNMYQEHYVAKKVSCLWLHWIGKGLDSGSERAMCTAPARLS